MKRSNQSQTKTINIFEEKYNELRTHLTGRGADHHPGRHSAEEDDLLQRGAAELRDQQPGEAEAEVRGDGARVAEGEQREAGRDEAEAQVQEEHEQQLHVAAGQGRLEGQQRAGQDERHEPGLQGLAEPEGLPEDDEDEGRGEQGEKRVLLHGDRAGLGFY